ncbi:autotransporter domain-containing protein, partial [Acinetobacter baumannii]
LVIGGFGGFEHLDFNSEALNSRLKGDGWTVGGYLGWQLAPDMRFDMMLGRSAIGYNDTAGTASATFRGARWLASGGLTGTYEVRGFLLQPLAKLY